MTRLKVLLHHLLVLHVSVLEGLDLSSDLVFVRPKAGPLGVDLLGQVFDSFSVAHLVG